MLLFVYGDGMKKIVCILISLAMVLSGCGTLEISFDVTPASAAAVPAVPATPGPVSSPQGAPNPLLDRLDEIQAAMLESATKWETVWMDGVVTWYDPSGSGQPPQVFHEQVWIDQTTSRFRVLLGPVDGPAETFKVCDGMTILELDLNNGQSQSHPLPDFAKASQFVPQVEPGVAYPNPIWGRLARRSPSWPFPRTARKTGAHLKRLPSKVSPGGKCWQWNGRMLITNNHPSAPGWMRVPRSF
jgi:hypothetical protein